MRLFITIWLIVLGVVAGPSVAAAEAIITVPVNQSVVLNVDRAERVAVANPEIADVLVVSGNEVLVVGKACGSTTLHVWSAAGRTTYEVEVGAGDATIAADIKNILGYPDIRVSKVNKTVILEGTVNDQYQKARAASVAGAYGEKVVNLLEITRPVQVKIEAKIIEINRQKTDELGIVWGNSTDSPGVFAFGQGSSGHVWGYDPVNAKLNLLIQKNAARVLSQPNTITLSGDKANIMIGGQIPVPVNNQNGQITVEWKDYGIKLEIQPEVNSQQLITSKVKAEVSSLDWNSAHRVVIGDLSIPPIDTRRAESAITVSSGQTMAIGGLIASDARRDITKVPLLGDIPILGNLFKSTSFTKNETELVILITSTIVDPASYLPNETPAMKSFIQENPWGGPRSEEKSGSSANK